MCLLKTPWLSAEQRCQGQEGSEERGAVPTQSRPRIWSQIQGPPKISLRALVCLLPWQPGRLECEPPAGRGGGWHRQLGRGHGLGHLASSAPGGEWAQCCGQLHLFPTCGPWELREVAGFLWHLVCPLRPGIRSASAPSAWESRPVRCVLAHGSGIYTCSHLKCRV